MSNVAETRFRKGKWIFNRRGSFGLQIPSILVDALRIGLDAPVEWVTDDRRLAAQGVRACQGSLDTLLAVVTPANTHGETGTGRRVGGEAW